MPDFSRELDGRLQSIPQIFSGPIFVINSFPRTQHLMYQMDETFNFRDSLLRLIVILTSLPQNIHSSCPPVIVLPICDGRISGRYCVKDLLSMAVRFLLSSSSSQKSFSSVDLRGVKDNAKAGILDESIPITG